MTITYKIGQSCPVLSLRGTTLTGGTICKVPEGAGVYFGSVPCVLLFKSNPGLKEVADSYLKEHDYSVLAAWEKKQRDLEVALPGLSELTRLQNQSRSELDRYDQEFSEMMDDQQNDGARPPEQINPVFQSEYLKFRDSHPRAAKYLALQDQISSASWSDNTGKSATAEEAIELLLVGEPLDRVVDAAAVRREVVD